MANDNKFLIGDIRMHGGYSTSDIVINEINNIIKMIESEGLKLSDIKFSCSFQNKKFPLNRDLIIDREDFDRITDYKYIDNEEWKQLLQFLNKHSYTYMDDNVVHEFIKEFLKIYERVFNNTMEEFEPQSGENICLDEFPLDINEYFIWNKIPYRLREVIIRKKKKYQLYQEHLILY